MAWRKSIDCEMCGSEIGYGPDDAGTVIECRACHCPNTIPGVVATPDPLQVELLERQSAENRLSRLVAPRQTYHRGVAAVLSLVIPGAGQIYRGDTVIGLVWLAATAIGYAAFVVPGLVLHVWCVLNAAK